jgi:hypothetical protein
MLAMRARTVLAIWLMLRCHASAAPPINAVTVEIKTGSRRIISYLLSPILKYKQDALRER